MKFSDFKTSWDFLIRLPHYCVRLTEIEHNMEIYYASAMYIYLFLICTHWMLALSRKLYTFFVRHAWIERLPNEARYDTFISSRHYFVSQHYVHDVPIVIRTYFTKRKVFVEKKKVLIRGRGIIFTNLSNYKKFEKI